MIYAAKVHTDRIILESFIGGIDATTDPEARRVLNKLCDLYAVSNLCADRGWFVEHGRMSAGRSKSLVRMVDQLCGELRPDALAVVEGLGMPERLLGAAILAPEA
jgi:acyl-CoA oxidase